MVYKLFDKKSMGSGIERDSSLILADELHKSVIKKFNKRKLCSQFRDNIWEDGGRFSGHAIIK